MNDSSVFNSAQKNISESIPSNVTEPSTMNTTKSQIAESISKNMENPVENSPSPSALVDTVSTNKDAFYNAFNKVSGFVPDNVVTNKTVAVANASYESTKEVVKESILMTKETLETTSSTLQYVTNTYLETTMDWVFKPVTHTVMRYTNKLVTEMIPSMWNQALKWSADNSLTRFFLNKNSLLDRDVIAKSHVTEPSKFLDILKGDAVEAFKNAKQDIGSQIIEKGVKVDLEILYSMLAKLSNMAFSVFMFMLLCIGLPVLKIVVKKVVIPILKRMPQ